MTMLNKTIAACPQCGKPYRVYMHTVRDQTLCPRCTAALEAELAEQDRYEELPDKIDRALRMKS